MFTAFKSIIFTVLLASAEAKLRTARQLSQEKIGSFTPITQVTDHAAIALDQEEIESLLADGNFNGAREVYENGAHSKSFAVLSLSSSLASSAPKGTVVSGTTVDDQSVTGKVYKDAASGANELQVQYDTKDSQASYVRCQVGGSSEPVTAGCFKSSGSIQVNNQSYDYIYTPESGNRNGRTIQGFSTSRNKHTVNGAGSEFYNDFGKFVDYYGVSDYADTWITAALTGTNAGLSRGNADFSSYGNDGRVESTKKGTAYMSIFMYVIRELEDAIDDCNRGCDSDDCNDDAVHALDEAVAFYGGALLGESDNGNLLYSLAEKRCDNFNTCGTNEAKVNSEIFIQFQKMQDNLLKKNCDAGRRNKERIAQLMYVPMIQGTLRYAYFNSEQNNNSEKAEAEGATFAAAVLPMVHACNSNDATAIYNNMRVGESTPADFGVVKAAFENNYGCMGITCEDVGGLFDGADYYPKAEPCGFNSSGSDANVGLAVGLSIGIVAALGLLCFFFKRRSSSQIEFKADTANPSV